MIAFLLIFLVLTVFVVGTIAFWIVKNYKIDWDEDPKLSEKNLMWGIPVLVIVLLAISGFLYSAWFSNSSTNTESIHISDADIKNYRARTQLSREEIEAIADMFHVSEDEKNACLKQRGLQ